MSKQYTFQPDYAVPPGGTLKETLEAKGITQAELSVRTDMAEKTISQIIHGIATISHETALKLEMATGVAAGFWNRLELNYRESLTRVQERERFANEAAWLRKIPVRDLVEREYVSRHSDKASLVRAALRFFGVSSVDAWANLWSRPSGVQFRGTRALARHPGRVAAWLRMGELDAQSVDCQPYSARGFKDALRRIRALTTKSPLKEAVAEAAAFCQAAGVAVVVVQEIAGAGVSGAAKWISKDKALIQLSLKYKTDDQLWFSFFHEAGHILLHGKKEVFLEDGDDSAEEREADAFARDILIPPGKCRRIALLRSKSSIVQFAASIDVSPGIVVGRLQHDGILKKSYCNDLKRKLKWE